MRCPEWHARLWTVLAAAQTERFKLGRHDCLRLAARALDAMSDSDQWRNYASGFDARRELKLMLVPGAVEREMTRAFGEPVPLGLARRGDLVALDMPSGTAIGICVGERIAVAADGVLYLPLARARCAWRVE
jgi:hypothetical protein